MNILRILLLPFVIVGRLIFWLLFAIAALLLLKRLGRRAPPAAMPSARPASEQAVETMVACTRCGLLLPESESLREGDAHYCCEEHRRGR